MLRTERARGERPCDRRAAEQRDEVTSSHAQHGASLYGALSVKEG